MREILFMWIAAVFGAIVGYIVGWGRRRPDAERPEERVLGAGSEPAVAPSVLERMEKFNDPAFAVRPEFQRELNRVVRDEFLKNWDKNKRIATINRATGDPL